MNGKGDSPRPISVSSEVFEHNMRRSVKNPKDRYREAVMNDTLPVNMTGCWADDRELWLDYLTSKGY